MVVIDAELQAGEMAQLAQAIQGAFGGQRNTGKANGSVVKALPLPGAASLSDEEDGDATIEQVEMEPAAAVPSKPRAPRKMRTPNLDSELHPEAEPSFKAYAEARNVTASAKVLPKFLIVAAWLHEERNGMKITANRVFTCFRFIGWPFNIDFSQPLRDMRAKSKYLELKPEDRGKGEYTLTHLGLNKATEMRVAK